MRNADAKVLPISIVNSDASPNFGKNSTFRGFGRFLKSGFFKFAGPGGPTQWNRRGSIAR